MAMVAEHISAQARQVSPSWSVGRVLRFPLAAIAVSVQARKQKSVSGK